MGRKKAKGQSGSGQGGAHRAQDPESDGPKVKPRGPANPYDDAPLGLCYFDADLRWVHINEWLAAVNGPPVSDHLGRTIGELLPDLAQAVEGQLRQVLKSGKAIEAETLAAETPAKPGIMRTFRHSFYPVKSSDGTVVGVSCAVQDITEREAAKEELERYKSMVTASTSLIAFLDSTFTYRGVNQTYCDEHRRDQDEILGHTVAEVIGEEVFEQALKPHLERCLAGERVTFSILVGLTKAGPSAHRCAIRPVFRSRWLGVGDRSGRAGHDRAKAGRGSAQGVDHGPGGGESGARGVQRRPGTRSEESIVDRDQLQPPTPGSPRRLARW